METLLQLFTLASHLSPLAVIALLVGLFYVVLWKQPSKQDFETIKTNDLHELPEVAANIRQLVTVLQRMEVSQEKNFATVIAKIEGKQ